MSPEERESYGRIADGFEKWLIWLLIVLALILLVTQPLMRWGDFRRMVSEVERGEGVPYGLRETEVWLDRYFGRTGSFNR